MNTEQAIVGATVISNVDFSGVPKGTRGTITEDYGTGVTVDWHLPAKPGWRPLRDGFDKQTELQYLDLIGGQP